MSGDPSETLRGRFRGPRAAVTAIALLLGIVSGCATVPFDHPRTPSHAITDTRDTELGRRALAWEAANPAVSGFHPLVDGLPAFGARLRLMELAESSIDAQYFLIKPDEAGALFTGELLRAADRGVRVRLLLDDIFTTAADDDLAPLDRHPHAEVRLFNPISRRGIPYLGLVPQLVRANRRMHNKTFTVDNEVSIVGGRNIADEYFQIRTDTEFIDFDMLAFGPVVPLVSETFDLFWNSPLAVPLEAFLEADEEALAEARVAHEELRAPGGVAGSAYPRAMANTIVDDLLAGRRQAFIAPVEVITDPPEKLQSRISLETQVLARALAEGLETTRSEAIVVTPYFIPTRSDIAFWERLAGRGVRVVLLTNSLASTNHVPVHAAFTRYRAELLRAGIEIYEARADAVDLEGLSGADSPDSLTLHMKALLLDRERLFVGSLNLDPRSIEINAEMGLLIESPEMTDIFADEILASLPEFAYRIVLGPDGELEWHGIQDGQEVVLHSEPQASLGRRILAWLSGILPESQL